MSNLSSWTTSAASNNAASPDGFPEGMAPSGVNDSAREMMAAVRRWYIDAEWINWGDTLVRQTNNSFLVSRTATDFYAAGQRVRLNDATTIYGKVISSSPSGANTLVTVSSSNLSSSLSSGSVNIINRGVQVFNSDGTFTVPSNVRTVYITQSGGGGGGSGGGNVGVNTIGWGGMGGAAGVRVDGQAVTVTPGAAITVTIGAGGTAGVTGAVGGTGGTTTFGALVSTAGGAGGKAVGANGIASAGAGSHGSPGSNGCGLAGGLGGGDGAAGTAAAANSGSGGGGGAGGTSGAGSSGGAGGSGYCIVRW